MLGSGKTSGLVTELIRLKSITLRGLPSFFENYQYRRAPTGVGRFNDISGQHFPDLFYNQLPPFR